MKIIFLDIDGVLNNRKSLVEAEKADELAGMDHRGFDELCVANLKEILEKTGAVMVMSSSWRMDFAAANLALHKAGLPPCIDKTPLIVGEWRGEEIATWLGKWVLSDFHEPVESFVILDDNSDMLEEQKPNFVHTSYESGLSCQNAKDAIKILLRKN